MTRVTGGVVLLSAVVALVVLLVHVVGVLLGMLASLDLVNLIHALALGKLVDLGADKAHQGLLGESVLDSLAYMEKNQIRMIIPQCILVCVGCIALSLTLLALVVLVGLHAGKGSGTGNELVREFALVLLAAVHLAVSFVRFA